MSGRLEEYLVTAIRQFWSERLSDSGTSPHQADGNFSLRADDEFSQQAGGDFSRPAGGEFSRRGGDGFSQGARAGLSRPGGDEFWPQAGEQGLYTGGDRISSPVLGTTIKQGRGNRAQGKHVRRSGATDIVHYCADKQRTESAMLRKYSGAIFAIIDADRMTRAGFIASVKNDPQLHLNSVETDFLERLA